MRLLAKRVSARVLGGDEHLGLVGGGHRQAALRASSRASLAVSQHQRPTPT